MTSAPVVLPPDSPFGRLLLPAVGITLGVLYALTRAGNAPPLLTALFGIVGVAYLPGLALSLWVENRFGLWASWILPLLLSPVLAVGAALLLTVSGFPMDRTPGWIVLLSALGVALAPQPRREIEDWAVSLDMPGFLRRRSDRQQVIGLASLVLVLIGATLLIAEWVDRSGEALFHIGVAQEILRGHVPPHDPYLAGVPIGTFWTFHAYLALLQGATRLGGAELLAGGSLIAAFVLVFTAYRILNLLALSHARSLWGAVFLFFALNGAFWLALPLRLLLQDGNLNAVGEVLWGSTPFLPTGPGPEGIRAHEGVFFLEAFLTSGPFVIAVAYLLLFLMATMATLGENRLRWNLLAIMAGVGMLLFHSGVGFLAFGVTLVSIPLIWIRAGLNPFRGKGREVFGVVLAMALALLVTAPYLAPILRRSAIPSLQYVNVSGAKGVFLLGALAPDLLFGVGVLVSFMMGGNVRRKAWAVWSLVLLLASFLVAFPGMKPLLPPLVLGHLPVALAAGASIPTWWQRAGRGGKGILVTLLVLFLVPVTAVGVGRYLIAPDPGTLTAEETEIARWVRDETPPHAVLTGTSPELALTAERVVLYARPSHAPSIGYSEEELIPRRAAFRLLLEGRRPGDRERALLLDLGAPVYVIHRLPWNPRNPAAGEYREVLRTESFVLHLWIPSGGALQSEGRGG